MDRVARIIRYIVVVVLVGFSSTGCYDRFDAPSIDDGDITPATITISDLSALYRGSTITINSNMVINGRVTSSDSAGNFRYSFMIEDSTGAVEIMARISDLHNTYPIGALLSVSLNGLAMGESLSVKQIGMPPAPYSYYPTEYITSLVELDSRIKRAYDGVKVNPMQCKLSALDRSLCGRLISVDNLRLAASSDGYWGGYDQFADSDGNMIEVYVREFATFAGRAIPAKDLSITGILQYGKGATNDETFILKISDEDCCISCPES